MFWTSLLPDLGPSLRFTIVPFPDNLSPARDRLQMREEKHSEHSQIPLQHWGAQAASAGAPLPKGNALPSGVLLAMLWLWCRDPAKVGTQSKSKKKSLHWEWACLAWNALPSFFLALWDVLWEADRRHATPNKLWNVRTISHKWQPCHVTMEVFDTFRFDSPSVSDRYDWHDIYFFFSWKSLCAKCNCRILCFPALQGGIPVLLWDYGPFNANPVSVLKWAVLHLLAMRESSGLRKELIMNIYSIIGCWHDDLLLQVK